MPTSKITIVPAASASKPVPFGSLKPGARFWYASERLTRMKINSVPSANNYRPINFVVLDNGCHGSHYESDLVTPISGESKLAGVKWEDIGSPAPYWYNGKLCVDTGSVARDLETMEFLDIDSDSIVYPVNVTITPEFPAPPIGA